MKTKKKYTIVKEIDTYTPCYQWVVYEIEDVEKESGTVRTAFKIKYFRDNDHENAKEQAEFHVQKLEKLQKGL